MAKVTKIEQHDWLAIRVTFPDGVKANVKWGRHDQTVTVTPPDSRRAAALSHIVMENIRRISAPDPTYPLKDRKATIEAMEKVALSATTLDEYIEGLKPALHVSGEPPKPAGPLLAESQATLGNKRGGFQLMVRFKDGSAMELSISRASVGLRMKPDVPSLSADISKLVFAAKQAGVMDDAAIAQLAKDTAIASDGPADWVEGMRAELFPAPGMRR
jgi:hypothetical protein